MEENRNLAVCHDSIDFLRLPQHRVCYFLAAGSVYSLPWESCIFWLQYARWIEDARWKSEKCVTKRLKIQHLVVLKPSLEFLPLSLGKYFAIWLAHFFFKSGLVQPPTNDLLGRRNRRSWWAWYIPMMWLRLDNRGGGKMDRKKNVTSFWCWILRQGLWGLIGFQAI